MTKQVLLFTFLLFGAFGWGQTYSENFDNQSYWSGGSMSSYNAKEYTLATPEHNDKFSSNNTVRETSYVRSGYAWRLKNTSNAYLRYECEGTVSGFSIYAARWDNNPKPQVTVRYSIDSGQNYTTAFTFNGDDFTGDKTFKQFSYSFESNITNDVGKKIYIEFLTTSGERMLYDDFEITFSSDPTITTSTTSLTNFTYTEGNGPSGEQSFTVEGSNLTGDITITPPANWEIATVSGGPYQTSAISLAQSGGTVGTTTIYTRMVAGLSHGTYSGNIVCSTDDGSGGTITENVAVDGSVTYSNASDIIANSGFSYTVNIPYVDYQADPITNSSESVGVFKFDIRDGGGSADSDALGTELTDITFSVGSTHAGYIRSAALFDGNTHLADGTVDAVTGEITFTGLSGADFTAPDDNIKSLTLRVSFTTNVTDNEQLQFTIISATADNNGSVFAEPDAGGAQSAVTGDKNRIEVLADRLIFGQQPTNTNVNESMTPAVTVKAIDVNANIDLDFANAISITSTGTLSSSPISENAVNGIASFGSIVHTAAGTGLILTASHTGFADVISTTFDITEITYNNGDYRTTGSGTWTSNDATPAIWQRYDGSSWSDSNSPAYNTSNAIFIRDGHTITTGGSFGNSVIINIMDGGILKINHSSTAASTKIYGGGSLKIYKNYQNNGAFEVEDNGELIIQYEFNNPFTSIWKGTENFHPNSTIIFKDYDCADDYLLLDDNSLTTNTYNGYTAAFGNLIFDFTDKLGNSDDWVMLESGVDYNMAHGDIIFRTNDNTAASMRISKTGTVTSGIGGNFIIEETYDGANYVDLKTSGTIDFTVKGNVELNAATFRVRSGSATGTSTLNIDGDLLITPSAVLNFNSTDASDPVSIVNLKGDLTVASSGLLYNTNSSNLGSLNFVGTGNGLTPETTQTIDIASTSSSENKYIDFNVNSGAFVQCINQDFELGKNSKLTVKAGGTYDFGFNGATALLVTKSGSQTGTAFDLDAGGYLKITSPDGIMSDSSAGNVQVVASNTTFSTLATFHYIGKADQVTGNAIGSSSNGRAIIVEMASNSLKLTPSQSFGITNATNPDINNNLGGILDIRKGQFIETSTEYITGSTGGLTMAVGTLYKIVKNSDDTSDVIPRLQGLSNVYALTGNSTIEIGGDNTQTLRGGRAYHNLTFSNAGLKTISSATPSITGELTIENAAILDVENKTMGGANTNFNMYNSAQYITAGTGTKPDAGGDYLLEETTKITFNNNESTEEVVRLGQGDPIEYANIDIAGSSVANNSLVTGIRMQAGTTFTVKNNAIFKLKNTTGFNGGTDTAIDNTNNPTITLESGSTIEYTGDNQTITDFTLGYQNLKISGNDTKTLFDNGDPNSVSLIKVNENLELISSTLRIENEKSISVDGDVTNTGEIIVENTGSLVQTGETATISGDGIYTLNKTSLPLNNYYDYVYWSSPLNSSFLTLGDILPGAWRYYEYDNSYQPGATYPYWRYLTSDHFVERGRGYAISAPAGSGTNNSIILNVSFTKGNDPFNTGSFDFTLSKHGSAGGDAANYNLIGNPYPSAIDFDALYNDNTSALEGNYSLWTNCAGLDGNQHHQVSGYSTYVVAGGNGTATSACSDSNRTAGRYIATGQGFMVEAKADNVNLSFKNSQRVAGNNTGFMNRPATQNRDIMWLDMSNNSGQFSQIAIGFYPGATDQYDSEYDAHSQNAGSGFSLYSLLDNHKLVIQGLAYNQADDKVIPLGVESDISGTVTFHLNHTEGFDNRDIFIKDNDLNVIHDLKNADYTVNVSAGINHDRFEIIFSRVLNIETLESNDNQLIIRQNSGRFDVYFKIEKNISRIQVYDITGRVIFDKKSLNTNLYSLDFKHIATGNMLIFKVIDADNHMYIKKLIKQ